MKNLIAKVSLLIFTFGIVGCEAPRENLALTLVLDNAIGDDKYPQYVKDIVMPFHKTECDALHQSELLNHEVFST